MAEPKWGCKAIPPHLKASLSRPMEEPSPGGSGGKGCGGSVHTQTQRSPLAVTSPELTS